jgi:hypothetical protein
VELLLLLLLLLIPRTPTVSYRKEGNKSLVVRGAQSYVGTNKSLLLKRVSGKRTVSILR